MVGRVVRLACKNCVCGVKNSLFCDGKQDAQRKQRSHSVEQSTVKGFCDVDIERAANCELCDDDDNDDDDERALLASVSYLTLCGARGKGDGCATVGLVKIDEQLRLVGE